MEQTKQQMAENLHKLQFVQNWAFAHGIHSFNIAATCRPLDDEGDGEEGLLREYGDTKERVIRVSIFKGIDDYLSVEVYQDQPPIEAQHAINRIKVFIGMEEPRNERC